MREYGSSINPTDVDKVPDNKKSGGFSALVRVESSRYVKREYQDPSLEPKVAVKWVMGTTKGNTFDRMWTTGVKWEDGIISPDGKQLAKDVSMYKNSDAQYLIRKAIASDYPHDKISNDISVFEGETFFMVEDVNPKSKGARKNLYPRQYHAEGWETALAEALRRRAEREAQQNAPAYQTASYTPPPVVQNDEVLKTAGEALVAILQNNGSTVSRNQIPSKFSSYVEQQEKATGRTWDQNFRKAVAVALWEKDQLQALATSNPNLKIDGDSISLQN